MPTLRQKLAQRQAEAEQERYRNNLRGSARLNRHVASESKMLDAQHDAEQLIVRRRKTRAAVAAATGTRTARN